MKGTCAELIAVTREFLDDPLPANLAFRRLMQDVQGE